MFLTFTVMYAVSCNAINMKLVMTATDFFYNTTALLATVNSAEYLPCYHTFYLSTQLQEYPSCEKQAVLHKRFLRIKCF